MLRSQLRRSMDLQASGSSVSSCRLTQAAKKRIGTVSQNDRARKSDRHIRPTRRLGLQTRSRSACGRSGGGRCLRSRAALNILENSFRNKRKLTKHTDKYKQKIKALAHLPSAGVRCFLCLRNRPWKLSCGS